MAAWEGNLYQRFAAYDDEELLRILTAERAKYRTEALTAAEKVLMRRGVAPPPAPAPQPQHPAQAAAPVARGPARPKSPYQLIDLFVDAILFGSLYWVTGRLSEGTLLPGAWLLDSLMRLLLSASVTVVVTYLRHGWRTKEWRD